MKKLLALVLALVMTLGLATVGANAAYKDADEVSFKEAVDVMSYVGVFQGNETGNFLPKANLDRASAAKLIAYLTAGEEIVEGLSATQKFNDVPASHWAAKYIAFCASQGYIAGAGDGNFYPASELTGYAFAKMLLCALGYDAKAEGLEGEGWEINVAKKLKTVKLNAGVDKALSAVLTREEAAQFCLNALQANMVEYRNGSSMVVGDVTITNPGTLTATDITLAESLYGAEINTTAGEDDFGRPATTWKFGTKKIATYAAEPTLEYTTKVKAGKIYTALGKNTPDDLTVIEDGVEWDEEDLPEIVSGGTDTIGDTGVLTQVYYDADADEATIILINTYVGKINKVTAAKKDADGDITTPANVEVVDVEDGYTDNFDTDAFKAADKGTFVLYTWADGEIQSVAVAGSEKDVTVRKLSAGKVNNYTVSFAGDDYYLPALERGASYDLYFDAYGNLIYATEVAAAENNNFVYVLKVGTPVVSYNDYGELVRPESVKALYIDAAGKTTQVDVKVTWSDDDEPVATIYAEAGKWATFVESDGVCTFTNVVGAVYGTANSIKASVPQLTAGLKANNNTTFVVKTKASPATYKVYEGLKNVPTMNKDGMLVTGINNDAGYAKLVYVDATNATGAAPTVLATPVFVLDWVSDEIDDSGDEDVLYSVYDAIVGKQLTTINVKDGVVVPEGIVTLTKDTKGYVTAFDAYDEDLYDTYELDEDNTVAFVEGTLELPGQAAQVLSESVAVYVFEDGALTESTAGAELNEADEGTLVVMLKEVSGGYAIDYFYWAK